MANNLKTKKEVKYLLRNIEDPTLYLKEENGKYFQTYNVLEASITEEIPHCIGFTPEPIILITKTDIIEAPRGVRKLSDYDMSVRAINAARRAGVETLEELAAIGYSKVKGIKKIGDTSIFELSDVMLKNGIWWKDAPEKIKARNPETKEYMYFYGKAI